MTLVPIEGASVGTGPTAEGDINTNTKIISINGDLELIDTNTSNTLEARPVLENHISKEASENQVYKEAKKFICSKRQPAYLNDHLSN